MKVAFSDISKTGNRYEIHDDGWFPGAELCRVAPVYAELAMNRKGESRVEVRGMLRTAVQLTCDRCLADYEFAVDTGFHLMLEVPVDEGWHVKELECTDTDLDTVQLSEPLISLWDILRQQLYLSLPEKRVCSADCRGLCPKCGRDLNSGDCSCVDEEKDSPFAVLAALKKK